jgi:hypothetical protein
MCADSGCKERADVALAGCALQFCCMRLEDGPRATGLLARGWPRLLSACIDGTPDSELNASHFGTARHVVAVQGARLRCRESSPTRCSHLCDASRDGVAIDGPDRAGGDTMSPNWRRPALRIDTDRLTGDHDKRTAVARGRGRYEGRHEVAAEGATWLVKKGELLDPSLAALRS